MYKPHIVPSILLVMYGNATLPQGKCRDNHKVSHSHSHKFAVFHPEAAIQVHDSLRRMREVIYEVSLIQYDAIVAYLPYFSSLPPSFPLPPSFST